MRELSHHELCAVAGGNAIDTVYGSFADEWCGTARTTWVPDQPLGFDFREACRIHDQCYSSGIQTFASCNADFRSNLSAACDGNLICEAVAWAYHQAVEWGGKEAYSNGYEGWRIDVSSQMLQETGWAY